MCVSVRNTDGQINIMHYYRAALIPGPVTYPRLHAQACNFRIDTAGKERLAALYHEPEVSQFNRG
jgi:hypothetical protein